MLVTWYHFPTIAQNYKKKKKLFDKKKIGLFKKEMKYETLKMFHNTTDDVVRWGGTDSNEAINFKTEDEEAWEGSRKISSSESDNKLRRRRNKSDTLEEIFKSIQLSMRVHCRVWFVVGVPVRSKSAANAGVYFMVKDV